MVLLHSPMKPYLPLITLLLSGCVSIEMPGIVADTTKVVKDVYKSATTKAEPAAPAASAATPTPVRNALSHSYIGTEVQSIADLKQVCVNEAAQKLNQLSGKTVRYSVSENEVVVINGKPVANCKLMAEG